jgi:hypothetical protein
LTETKRLEAVRHERIRLGEDPPRRTHHAIIFNTKPHRAEARQGPEISVPVAGCKLPEWMTWTPTGHGSVGKWDIVTSEKSDQISENELALLVPRSLWIWFVPRLIRNFSPLRLLIPQDPKDLFYLEGYVEKI